MPKNWKHNKGPGHMGAPIYFLGFIGSAAYYLHTTVGFWASVEAVLKALVWPAFLVYHLLGL
jgi:hypothetical protein